MQPSKRPPNLSLSFWLAYALLRRSASTYAIPTKDRLLPPRRRRRPERGLRPPELGERPVGRRRLRREPLRRLPRARAHHQGPPARLCPLVCSRCSPACLPVRVRLNRGESAHVIKGLGGRSDGGLEVAGGGSVRSSENPGLNCGNPLRVQLFMFPCPKRCTRAT